MKRETVFFSNYLEALFEKFKEHLFTHLSLSSLIYVLVPGDKVKQWLMKRLVKDEGILGAVSFYTLSDLIPLLKKESFPDLFELELLVQEQIFLQISQRKKEETLDALYSFLSEGGKTSSKRVLEVSRLLSELFSLYGIYGKEMLAFLEKSPGWQAALWRSIFIEKKWKTPMRDLFSMEDRSFEKRVEIHLFAPSHLPALYREELHRLSFHSAVYFYLLSPTFCFWEDLVSDRERRSLLQFWKRKEVSAEKREEMDVYLQDRNALLANLGKIGRETLKILDREELQIEEYYAPFNRDSLLHSLQEDLLSLTNPQSEEKEVFSSADRSLQIHEAPSLLQEVDCLYQFLLKEIGEKKLSFSDITVASPDISLYEPFIHRVFGEGQIPYRIFDLPLCEKSSFAKGLRDFFHLMHSRWTKEDLFALLENPSIQNKHPLDIEELKGLFLRAHISWGIDSEHRTGFLETKNSVSGQGTWQGAIESLLDGFVLCQEKRDPLSPSFFFEKSEAPLLDRFLLLFERLKEDIAFLEKAPLLSLAEAADFFERIACYYFAIDSGKAEEQKAFSLFQETLKKIRCSAKKLEEKKFLTDGLIAHLLQRMRGTFATPSSLLETVHFQSMKEGAFVPSKIVCLMGLNEEFPRNETVSSLNLLLKEKKREYVPSQNEKDRALFLEALLSARNILYISTGQSNLQHSRRSLIIEELLAYLESRFSFEKDVRAHIVRVHPLFSFDRIYFEKNPAFENFSSLSYQAAKSYYREKRKEKNIWEEEICSPLEDVIESKSLERLASHPVKFFFQKSLQIFLHEEEKEHFSLSSLDRHLLRSSLLQQERREILAAIEKNGSFPGGSFLEMIKEEAEKELLSYEENLLALGVDKKKIFSVDMIEGCEEPVQKESGDWIAPPLELMRKGKKVTIVGRIDRLSEKGILHHGHGSLWDWIRIWPRLLLYRHFPFLEKGDVLFTKSAKKKEIVLGDLAPLFAAYLDYYEKAKQSPSPLLRDWAEGFFLGEKELEEEIVRTTFMKRGDDPYLERLFFLSEKPSASFLQERWKKTLMSALQPILSPFLEKKEKKEEDVCL